MTTATHARNALAIIESTPYFYKPDNPKIEEKLHDMHMSCGIVDWFVDKDYAALGKEPPTTVLDLGSGLGFQVSALAGLHCHEAGVQCHITAIEKSAAVMKKMLEEEKSVRQHITPIVGDIVTMPFYGENDYELAICCDVLFYLNPKDLIPTLKKIYQAVMPGGEFLGTLLISKTMSCYREDRLMGITVYYASPTAFIRGILKLAGFEYKTHFPKNKAERTQYPDDRKIKYSFVGIKPFPKTRIKRKIASSKET